MNGRGLLTVAALACAAHFALSGAGHAQQVMKIGAVAPKTGPLGGGAAVTHWPSVQLWVQQVNADGPAERAGIRGGNGEVEFQAQSFRSGGDVITKVAGKPVENSAQLADVIAGYQPGQEVPLEVHRDGDTKEIKVKLGERPLSAPQNGG